MAGANTKKRSRCPNGMRKNSKTGNCEPKKSANTNRKPANTKKRSRKLYKYKVKANLTNKPFTEDEIKELLKYAGYYDRHKDSEEYKTIYLRLKQFKYDPAFNQDFYNTRKITGENEQEYINKVTYEQAKSRISQMNKGYIEEDEI